MQSFDSVTITAYSSLQPRQADWLRALVGMVAQHFGTSNFLEGEFVDDAGESSPGRSITQLMDHEIEGRLANGGFSFVGADKRNITGFVSTDRFRVASIDTPQSEIGITLPSEYGNNPALGIEVRAFCQALARHGRCNLVFCADHEHFDVRFDTALHVGIGLLDVYWINVFGPIYTKLIGRDKLCAISACFVACDADDYGTIQVGETLKQSIEPTGQKARQSVRASLGEDYFAKPRSASQPTRGVEISIWQPWELVRLFQRQKTAFKDTSRKANIVPDLKYRGEQEGGAKEPRQRGGPV